MITSCLGHSKLTLIVQRGLRSNVLPRHPQPLWTVGVSLYPYTAARWGIAASPAALSLIARGDSLARQAGRSGEFKLALDVVPSGKPDGRVSGNPTTGSKAAGLNAETDKDTADLPSPRMGVRGASRLKPTSDTGKDAQERLPISQQLAPISRYDLRRVPPIGALEGVTRTILLEEGQTKMLHLRIKRESSTTPQDLSKIRGRIPSGFDCAVQRVSRRGT